DAGDLWVSWTVLWRAWTVSAPVSVRLHADRGAGQQLIEQIRLDVAAADDHDGAPPADRARVVKQRGQRGRGGRLAHDPQRAIGVDDRLADLQLADQRDVGEVVARHREVGFGRRAQQLDAARDDLDADAAG